MVKLEKKYKPLRPLSHLHPQKIFSQSPPAQRHIADEDFDIDDDGTGNTNYLKARVQAVATLTKARINIPMIGNGSKTSQVYIEKY